jgi:hypothetical protein
MGQAEPLMEETQTDPNPQAGQADGWRRDACLILLLILLTAGLRTWVITHTAVAARDSIGFIRYAWRLEREPLVDVLRGSLHPPLYPLTVLAVSYPVRHFLHRPDCLEMQYSAQIACALCGVLLTIPMYYLGKRLFDRSVGFWSALMFQCLPVPSHMLSDGLTEGIYLLLIATFLLAAGWALKTRRVSAFALCGVLSGLTYLTRPEGAALALVLGGVLLAIQFRPALRWPLRRSLESAFALAFSALIVAAPYMCVIGGFSNKYSINWMTHSKLDGTPRVEADRTPSARLPLARMDNRLLVAGWDQNWTSLNDQHPCSLNWALKMFAKEVGKGFHYIVWVPALLGVYMFRRRGAAEPTAWVAGALCVFHFLVLIRLAMVAGYLSERHSLVFVLCGAPWAVACVRELPVWLAHWVPSLAGWLTRPAVATLAVAVLALYGLPAALQPLHPSRIGFREAGFWIANHADPSDPVIDPFCWSEFYAGRILNTSNVEPTVGHQPVEYVVLDRVSLVPVNPREEHHSHLPVLKRAKELAQAGHVVYYWPTTANVADALVKVFAVPVEKLKAIEPAGTQLNPGLAD